MHVQASKPPTAPAFSPAAPDLLSGAAKKNHSDFLITLGLLGDGVAIFFGVWLGYWLRFRSGWIPLWIPAGENPPFYDFIAYFNLIIIGTIFLLLTFGYLQLYDTRNLLRFRHAAQIILTGSTFWLFAYLGVSLALKFEPPISRIYVLCAYVTSLAATLLWRRLFHTFLERESIACGLRQRLLFVGWNPDADRMAEQVEGSIHQSVTIMGYVPSARESAFSPPPPYITKLGDYADLPKLLKQSQIDIVVLNDLNMGTDQIVALANLCEKELVQFKIIPTYFQILVSGLHLETISGVPLMGVSQLPLDRFSNRLIKRTVDIVGATVGLVLSLPIIFVCGVLVYCESPGPIFYRQVRVGRNGKEFKIIKLRSMRPDAEQNGVRWAEKNDPRRLKVGVFMREWNLDEVPQFWNVVKGEMSLVGPRPEMVELTDNFKEEIPHYNARLASKPGITGWAQVNGLRGNTSLVERVRYDLFYLENWSLWLDLQILVLTFFKRENAY